ncbi:enoyl-CoA hydratase/isomerase family protein [Nocardia salmonicida]|uniref:enoyl-CoA hydratase/isomerase family protein n=1 Tax=Nocardia salmonicida TaxID=53431 RepID=UPI00363D1032
MNTLSLTRDGAVVHVRLEQPDTLNAHTHQMWFELRQLGAELGHDTSIRALVLSGAGRSFSAGLDVSVLADFAGAELPEDLRGLTGAQMIGRVQQSFTWLADAPYPTIAAVTGHALGAGFQLALACDIRIASDDASFGLLETNWGLMPDLGGTVWLPQLVGPAKAKQLMWLAEHIGATEALTLGIVERVVSVEELAPTASALAARLAARPPLAVTAIKQAVRSALDTPHEAFAAAAERQARCLSSSDLLEAGAAWSEKREPVYTGT